MQTQEKEKTQAPIQITGAATFSDLKVIYGACNGVPGTLTQEHHGMNYVVSGVFRSNDSKIYYGYPELCGKIEFAKHRISGEFTIFGRGY